MGEVKLNQQQELKAAKDHAAAEIATLLNEKFDHTDDYKWTMLCEGPGYSRFVELSLTAKKEFDLDEALEEYAFKRKEREAKEEKKNKKKDPS